jgi:hypothetical protein
MSTQHAAAAIAKMLYDAGIRLDTESDLLAMSKADKETRYAIVTKYRELCNQDVQIEIDFRDLPNHHHNVWEWVYETAYEDIKGRLSDEVDSELWILQCVDRADAWVDDAIDRMQVRGAA